MIFSITYRSRCLIPRADLSEGLNAILSVARRQNAAQRITGALLADGERFAQVIEGERGPVERLMARIADDPRHAEVTVLVREFQVAPRFPIWSMAFVGDGGAEVQRLLSASVGGSIEAGPLLADTLALSTAA